VSARIARVVFAGSAAAVIVGSVDGVIGRLLMRLFTVARDGVPSFSLAGSLVIVIFFVVSAVPGGVASAATRRRRLRWTLYALGTAPLVWNGLVIGVEEWAAAIDRGVSAIQAVLLVLLTLGIAAVTFGNPVVTHRLAVLFSDLSRQSSAGPVKAQTGPAVGS
jgi:hypothetical protein